MSNTCQGIIPNRGIENSSMKIAYCGPVSLSILLPDEVKAHKITDGYSYPFGAYFVQELLARNYKVTVVTSSIGVKQILEFDKGSLKVMVCPRRHPKDFVLDFYSKERMYMLKALESSSPDIVHAQWSYEFCHVAKHSGFPYVVTFRDAPWQVFRHTRSIYRLYRALYAYWAMWRVKQTTAVSPYIANSFKKFYLVDKPIVVPNALNPRVLIEDMSRQATRACPHLISVSAWNSLKNCKTTLRAFALIRQRIGDGKLKLIGAGLETNGPAHRWARQEGLDDKVEFLGKLAHDEVLSCMRQDADLFLYPSLEESFCMVVLEAMACGLPVVVLPKTGALPWLVDHGKAGVIAKSRRPASIAIAAEDLLRDNTRYKSVKHNAAERVKQYFTMDAVVNAYIDIYRKVLNDAKKN